MTGDGPAPDVLSLLVDNHRQFRAFVARRVGSSEDAEDILQAAYVKSVERGGELRESESAIAWFYRLLRNAVVDHYRSRDVADRALETVGWNLPEAPEPEVVGALCRCMHALLPTLRPGYAEILRRVDLEEGEIPAAAEAIGISAGNARVRLHRARKALRRELERSCGTCTEHGCLDCTCGGGV